MFLCHLASREQIGGPPVAFNHLYQQASFSQGRNGHKSTRTVEIEIDNFRRAIEKLGLVIVKQRHGAALTYALDLTRCTVDAAARFPTRLNTLRGSSDTLGDWIAAPMTTHLAWLFAVMRSKVAFAQGRNKQALTLQKQALALTDDTGDIDLGRGFGERKVGGTKAYRQLLLKKLAQKFLNRPLKIGKTDIRIDQ